MKRAVIILGLILIAFLSKAINPPINDIVITDDKTYFGDKVVMGPSSVRIYNKAGEITKIPSHAVESFIRNGQVFVKMPVITKANDTVGMAFMQYITSRSGLQLFRYCSHCLNYDPVAGVIAPLNQVFRYYVFKGGKFIMLLEEDNATSFLSYFGVKVLA
ncbi:MAG: hypothetical protein ACOYMF_12455 [Bacteroidales bacterium]